MKVEINFNPADLCLVRETSPAPEKPEVSEERDQVDPKARQLALAHHIHALIASGEMEDIAHVARVARVSRARISQVRDLALLEPGIQEAILEMPAVTDGRDPLSERRLREIALERDWQRQASADVFGCNARGN